MTVVLIFYLVIIFLLLLESNEGVLDWKMPVAGGIAGGLANAIIHPIDTVKTILQTDTTAKNDFHQVVQKLRGDGIMKIYSGFFPAVFGSMPSSALYFGAYEFFKGRLESLNYSRPIVSITAAAGGNLASSIIFVPKEVLKQQLQAYKTGTMRWNEASKISASNVVKRIMKTHGIKGLYPSYRATLARNIPSAMIRFGVYEELKYRLRDHIQGRNEGFGLLIVGGAASALSSSITTPLDVIKTRLSTGLLPVGSPILLSMISIARREGFGALYAGMFERTLWSALYGGIGLACYDLTKKALGKISFEGDSKREV